MVANCPKETKVWEPRRKLASGPATRLDRHGCHLEVLPVPHLTPRGPYRQGSERRGAGVWRAVGMHVGHTARWRTRDKHSQGQQPHPPVCRMGRALLASPGRHCAVDRGEGITGRMRSARFSKRDPIRIRGACAALPARQSRPGTCSSDTANTRASGLSNGDWDTSLMVLLASSCACWCSDSDCTATPRFRARRALYKWALNCPLAPVSHQRPNLAGRRPAEPT